MPALYLHKVIHPQAHDNCRIILKYEVGAVEIGSIGIPVLKTSLDHTKEAALQAALCRYPCGCSFSAHDFLERSRQSATSHANESAGPKPRAYRRRLSGTLSGGGF